jgi:nucleoside-diphosphate-sugar epimerase
MDISRISADTGYQPEYDIRAGIGDYIGWLRDNPQ